MAGFDFFRSRRPGYQPRTPAAALKAVGTGTVPVEQFVYASASAKPLDEEPFDLEEIERVLARTDLTLQTRILLKRVLGKLLVSREQEVALFGAEGITTLESRALMQIERLRTQVKINPGPELRRRLARELYEMAELQSGSESVRAFYLREAFSILCGDGMRPLSRADLPLAVDILVARRLLQEAGRLLAGFRRRAGCRGPVDDGARCVSRRQLPGRCGNLQGPGEHGPRPWRGAGHRRLVLGGPGCLTHSPSASSWRGRTLSSPAEFPPGCRS